MYKYVNKKTNESWEVEFDDDVVLMELCPDCNGEGELWDGPNCNKPKSMCCGGCGEMIKCSECNGEGWIE